MRVRQYSKENPILFREKKLSLVCLPCEMPSFALCLHEETDTRIFARATEAAKRPNKQISSCTVDTDVVVLVIPMVQQWCVDEMQGWQKSPAIVGVMSNCLAFFHSLTGCKKTYFILNHGKQWVSFQAVTGYFVKK